MAFQRQRELNEKFDERFLGFKGSDIRDQFGVNQWMEQRQIVTSLDLAKRTEILPGLAQVYWDLVIVDEAHRMSARDESHKSQRYRLGELLRDSADHMLLLTATPHKGAPQNFTLFLQLLDPRRLRRREVDPRGDGSAACPQERHGLKIIDLGAGHASAGGTLCGRIISVLKTEARLNESVGAGYLDRNWPPALKPAGEWPLNSLRQSFLNGSLTRLIDPDAVPRRQIIAFVSNGDFGFASGRRDDCSFGRLWYLDLLLPEEVAFEANVFLLTKTKAEEYKND